MGWDARARLTRPSARCRRAWLSNWRCSNRLRGQTGSAMGKREQRTVLVILCATLVATLIAGCAPPAGNGSTTPTAPSACVAVPRQEASHDPAACPPAILVFSKTAEFRHDSIPAAQAALRQLAS